MEFPLPFSLALLPTDTYLVGGAVRDVLLNRQRYPIDLDLVVPVDAIELARTIASQHDAGFVILDAERSIARLVFAEITVDFAQQVGGSLESDLHRRDYRMNAIAYHLPTQKLVDPLGGVSDIEQRIVRMIAAENLADDPLRLLRGYRQAAQLGFSINPATQETIQKLAPLLSQVAAERVFAEIRYLINSSFSDPRPLAAAVQTGLFNDWLPSINSNYSDSMLLDGLNRVVAALQLIDRTYPALSQLLHTNLRPTINMTGAGVAVLAFLMQPIAASSEQLLIKLTASTAEIKAIQTAITHWLKLAKLSPEQLTDQYHLFREVGTVFPVAVILSLANDQPLSRISHLIERYLDPQDPLAHPVPLLNGTELMQALALQPSPLVGQLLQELQLAQVCNKIRTKPEAVNYALNRLKKLSSCYI
jgi:tRNA nucleotidyltransferase (CCA-adding enzyme)